jgi:flagellin-specific chaperone FliS
VIDMSDRSTDARAGAKLSRENPPVGETRAADTSIPERYTQLLTKIAHADRALETGDGGSRGESLGEASGLVFDLLYALDFRRGGETVPRLAAIYGYIGNELLSVARTGDRQKLAHLRDMVATLRRSWYDSEAGERPEL